ncbi:hypothetical protein BB561_005672 [Smittium simulii]|uniref:Uncharacterized protein n=1 Tax=Smittium simulii TaxID=133385 RepID=A0A2T9Y940_9FUNG|nr:hypothetical protein BB561_005672 [Smittium simulii]
MNIVTYNNNNSLNDQKGLEQIDDWNVGTVFSELNGSQIYTDSSLNLQSCEQYQLIEQHQNALNINPNLNTSFDFDINLLLPNNNFTLANTSINNQFSELNEYKKEVDISTKEPLDLDLDSYMSNIAYAPSSTESGFLNTEINHLGLDFTANSVEKNSIQALQIPTNSSKVYTNDMGLLGDNNSEKSQNNLLQGLLWADKPVNYLNCNSVDMNGAKMFTDQNSDYNKIQNQQYGNMEHLNINNFGSNEYNIYSMDESSTNPCNIDGSINWQKFLADIVANSEKSIPDYDLINKSILTQTYPNEKQEFPTFKCDKQAINSPEMTYTNALNERISFNSNNGLVAEGNVFSKNLNNFTSSNLEFSNISGLNINSSVLSNLSPEVYLGNKFESIKQLNDKNITKIASKCTGQPVLYSNYNTGTSSGVYLKNKQLQKNPYEIKSDIVEQKSDCSGLFELEDKISLLGENSIVENLTIALSNKNKSAQLESQNITTTTNLSQVIDFDTMASNSDNIDAIHSIFKKNDEPNPYSFYAN